MTNPSTSETLTRPWAHVPADLLPLISRHLADVADYIAFRSVCSSWRSSAPPAALPPQRPWLLLPHDPTSSLRSFYNPAAGKIYALDFPETLNKHVCGSAHGWLALIADDSSLSLWNPITRSQIPLPPPTQFPGNLGPHVSRWECGLRLSVIDEHCSAEGYLGLIRDGCPWKVFFSSDPNDSGCLVAVTLVESLDFVYCRVGDEAWTILHSVFSCPIVSIAFGKGRVFALDMDGNVVILDLDIDCNGHTFVPSTLIQKPEGFDRAADVYLLGVGAELYLVLNYSFYAGDDWLSMDIFHFNLNGEDGCLRWLRASSIDDLAFFLSGNHSSVVHARDISGCKPDCVYFSDCCYDHEELTHNIHEMHLFSVKGNSYETLACPWEGTGKELRNPTWFTPSLR